MLTRLIAGTCGCVLTAGIVTVAVTRGMVPSHYTHDVHVDGTVDLVIDVTVHTPDLAKLKPGQIVPQKIDVNVHLPTGFNLNVPNSQQTVDVHAPTNYTVRQAP